jgi:hypothetical protein
MSKTSLKSLRLLVPGLLLVVGGVIPIFFGPTSVATTLALNEKLLVWLLPFVLGALYHILNLRRYFFAPAIEDINDRLIRSLLEPFSNHEVIGPAFARIKTGRKVLNIFYNIVDNDKSLTERAKHVYLNGLLLSSLADVRAITFLLLPFYLGSLVFSKQPVFLWYIGGAIVLHIISARLITLVRNTHMELGAKQTDFILQIKRAELERLLIEEASRQ